MAVQPPSAPDLPHLRFRAHDSPCQTTHLPKTDRRPPPEPAQPSIPDSQLVNSQGLAGTLGQGILLPKSVELRSRNLGKRNLPFPRRRRSTRSPSREEKC